MKNPYEPGDHFFDFVIYAQAVILGVIILGALIGFLTE